MSKKSKIIVFIVSTILTAGILFATVGKNCPRGRMMGDRKECMSDSTACNANEKKCGKTRCYSPYSRGDAR